MFLDYISDLYSGSKIGLNWFSITLSQGNRQGQVSMELCNARTCLHVAAIKGMQLKNVLEQNLMNVHIIYKVENVGH